MPTRLAVVQNFDAAPERVFALYGDRDFVEGRLHAGGGQDPQVVSLESGEDTVSVVTRQSIPASVLPSMVRSMIPGDLLSERTETWRQEGDGYLADFGVVIKGAPATLKGTMALAPSDGGSTLTIDGQASVPIPFVGGKLEGVIVEQVAQLLAEEEAYTRQALVT